MSLRWPIRPALRLIESNSRSSTRNGLRSPAFTCERPACNCWMLWSGSNPWIGAFKLDPESRRTETQLAQTQGDEPCAETLSTSGCGGRLLRVGVLCGSTSIHKCAFEGHLSTSPGTRVPGSRAFGQTFAPPLGSFPRQRRLGVLALRLRQLGDGGCIVADIRKTFGYPLDHRSSMRSAAVLADGRESPLIHRCLPRRSFCAFRV